MATRGIVYATQNGAALALGSPTMTIEREISEGRVLVHDGGDYIISAPFGSVALLVATLDAAATANRVVISNGVAIYTPAESSGAPTVFEISPGQLRNRMPWQAEDWLESNVKLAPGAAGRDAFAAVIWGRIKGANTINVLSSNVQQLGTYLLTVPGFPMTRAQMDSALAPVRYDGETRTSLIG